MFDKSLGTSYFIYMHIPVDLPLSLSGDVLLHATKNPFTPMS